MYTVGLKVSGQNGKAEEIKHEFITVQPLPYPPVARFKSDIVTGRSPATVHFQDMSTGVVSSWNWDLGDGNSSTEQNPVNIYSEPGIYSVTQIVSGPGGNDTLVRRGYITVTSPAIPPVAGMYAEPVEGAAPLTVRFMDTSSGDVTGWHWDLGDNSTSTNKNPTHIFQSEGIYTVNLKVTGPEGESSSSLTINVTPRGQGKKASSDKNSFPVLVPGSPVNLNNLSGFYNASAPSEPKLSQISPHGKPTAIFTLSGRSGRSPVTITFHDRSTGNITGRQWDFGDGETSVLPDPVHTYQHPGSYTVCLTVTGPEGTSKQQTREAVQVF